jgi:UTP-glucose-1-phosphate uridylyltransferase
MCTVAISDVNPTWRVIVLIKKCLFPVAGYGTRFLPATKSMPKEMLPVVNKPLVQYGVEEAIAAGMTTCAMVTGRGKRAIADHFDISYELEHQISGTGKEMALSSIRNVLDKGVFTTVRQREMKGLGHAILTGDHTVFVDLLRRYFLYGHNRAAKLLVQLCHLRQHTRAIVQA